MQFPYDSGPDSNKNGWYVISIDDSGEAHIVPNCDTDSHYSEDCPCGPRRSMESDNVTVHKAFDGREKAELAEGTS